MKIYSQTGARYFVAAGALGSLLLTQGCIATRDWVKEQMDPLSTRVSTNEQKFDSRDCNSQRPDERNRRQARSVRRSTGSIRRSTGSGRCENRQGSQYVWPT